MATGNMTMPAPDIEALMRDRSEAREAARTATVRAEEAEERVRELEREAEERVRELEREAARADEAEDTVVEFQAKLREVEGLVVMALWAGGSTAHGNVRQLVRCAPAGQFAESWMVVFKGKVYTRDGNPIPARPYHQLRATLQPHVRRTLAEARKFAGKLG